MITVRNKIYVFLVLSSGLFFCCDDNEVNDKFVGTYRLEGSYKNVFDGYGVHKENYGTGSFDSTVIAKEWVNPEWEYRFKLGDGSPWVKMTITGDHFNIDPQNPSSGSSYSVAGSGHVKGDSIYVSYGYSYRGSSTSWNLSGAKKN
jgi:hypothetical protein